MLFNFDAIWLSCCFKAQTNLLPVIHQEVTKDGRQYPYIYLGQIDHFYVYTLRDGGVGFSAIYALRRMHVRQYQSDKREAIDLCRRE